MPHNASQSTADSTHSQNGNSRETLSTLMVAIHRIAPELADRHVAQMTDPEIAEMFQLYRRSLAAVRLLTRIRREEPELWTNLRLWAERESANV